MYSKDIKVVKVPQTEALSIAVAMRKANTAIDLYLPTYDYDKYPNRDWLCNLLNSLEYPKFQKLITDCLNDREKMLILRKKMNVVAISEIRNIFIKSQNVSLSKVNLTFYLEILKLAES